MAAHGSHQRVLHAALLALVLVVICQMIPSGGRPGGGNLRHWLTRPTRHVSELPEFVASSDPSDVPILVELLDWKPSWFEGWINSKALADPWWLPDGVREYLASGSEGQVRNLAAQAIALLGKRATKGFPRFEQMARSSSSNINPYLGLMLLTTAPDEGRAAPLLEQLLTNALTAPIVLPAMRQGPPVPYLLGPMLNIITNRSQGYADALEFLPDFGPSANDCAGVLMTEIAEGKLANGTRAAMHNLRDQPRLEQLALLGPDAIRPHLPELLSWAEVRRIPLPHTILRTMRHEASGFSVLLQRRLQDASSADFPSEASGDLASSLAAVLQRPDIALPVLVAELGDASSRGGFGTFGPPHPRLCRGPFGPIRLHRAAAAAWLLGELGPDAVTATADLGTVEGALDEMLPVVAAWSLWKITSDPTKSVTALRAGLESDDPITRYVAVVACNEIPPIRTELLPRIQIAIAAEPRIGLAFPEIHPSSGHH